MHAFQTRAVVKFADAIPPIGAGNPAGRPRLPLPIWRDVPLRASEELARFWRLIVFVFLPFAAGFYLSYLFRTINALISGDLTSDLSLGAADLGLLTSVYFLSFCAGQIPIGVMLDRYGPRRVQSALLLIAAVGAALFAISEGFATLVLARALIGLGVAAALMAGLKAIVLWFPRERVATANGYMVMFGALGALTATAPAELLLARIGWRGLFELLAIATAATAVVIYLVVPEPRSAASASKRSAGVGLRTIYTDPRFWRLAPLSATCVGSAWALQGLWAAPWLTDVEGIDRPGLIGHLFVMAVALGAGGVLLGTAADRLARRGIGPEALMAIVAVIFIATQLALILQLPVPSYLSWSVVGAVGAGTVLSYAIVAEYFPKELAGRANGALNVFHLGGAFVLQYSIGLILQRWAADDGHYPATAYQIAFGANVALQILALIWFELQRLQRLFLAFLSTSLCVLSSGLLQSRMYYRRAVQIWARRVDSARAQAQNWRLATLRSAGAALFGLTLAISARRARVTPYVVEVTQRPEAGAVNPTAATDAQIAYFLSSATATELQYLQASLRDDAGSNKTFDVSTETTSIAPSSENNAKILAAMDWTKRLAVWSVLIGIIVLGLKYFAYYLTGSIALYSDALESIVNVATAVAALFAVHVSAKPADAGHPFGHSKVEYFSAVVEGVLIVVAALSILRQAYFGFLNPTPLDAPLLGMAVNGAAGVLNALWCWVLITQGRKHRSPALVADGRHLLTDVLTSVGVLIGVGAAYGTGVAILDPSIAVLIALNILWSGWGLMKESVGGLMDEAVPAAMLDRIRNVISAEADGAIEAHDLRTRCAGKVTFVEFHLVVSGGMSVADAHGICDRIESALQSAIEDARVTIHVEPENMARHSGVLVLTP